MNSPQPPPQLVMRRTLLSARNTAGIARVRDVPAASFKSVRRFMVEPIFLGMELSLAWLKSEAFKTAGATGDQHKNHCGCDRYDRCRRQLSVEIETDRVEQH